MATAVVRSSISGSASRLRYLCTSTPVAASSDSVSISEENESSWFRRLRSIHVTNKSKELSRTLDGWVADGADVKKFHLCGWIQRLRQIKLYTHALQVSQWMEKKKIMNIVDRAMHIDLLFKTKGIAEAERYFNSLENPEKTVETFGSLLSCYCRQAMPGKAMYLVEKMKDFGIVPSTWNINHLLFLHLKIGEPEKVPLLVQVMDDYGFAPDMYTYNHLMNSYAALKDYDGVERVLEKMLASEVKPHWATSATLARIYIKAGYFNKAAKALENIENMKSLHAPEGPEPFNKLITLYGEINNLSSVYRIWETVKSKPNNFAKNCYLSLLTTLAKLGDVDGLDKYFNEWKASSPRQDMRVYDVILKSYLDRDMLPEAKSLSEKLVTKQIKPTFVTLSIYINFYLKKGQIDNALHYLEQGAAQLKGKRYNDWFPDENTVAFFLKSLAEKQDDISAQKFSKIMKGFARGNTKAEILVKDIETSKVEVMSRVNLILDEMSGKKSV